MNVKFNYFFYNFGCKKLRPMIMVGGRCVVCDSDSPRKQYQQQPLFRLVSHVSH